MTTALVASPYGRDTSCLDQIATGVIVSDWLLVGQALYRRFITERGQLENDPNYGLNLIDWLQSNDPTGNNLLALRSEIIAECLKDERVDDVSVTLTPTQNGPAIFVAIDIEVTLSTSMSFTLSLNVNDVTVELLGLAEAA